MSRDINDGQWIQTYTGGRFWPLDPRAEDVCIEDIAHALGNTARFNGHTLSFYSVAQHSVLVSHAVPPEHALWGLMHDAAEAYLGDMVRPVKHQPALVAYRAAEERLERVIAEAFGLPWPMPAAVKEADDRALLTEKRDLLGSLSPSVPCPDAPWGPPGEPLPERIAAWSPHLAKVAFLDRFAELSSDPRLGGER